MIRRIFISIFALALLGLSMTASAQSDPLPLPADATAPVGPIERTEADLAAIRQLDEAAMESARNTTTRANVSHTAYPVTIRVGITPYVHCGDWLRAGQPITQIITLDFREYVKNVLPNEWPNAWPTESLRAGAIAVKMFGWWRYNVVRLAPGARPPGVDVVDNTCDMVFWPNSAKPPTSAAVDDTWAFRATHEGIVRETHFLSTQSLCSAYGFPRCMPQWGTKDMADLGDNWQTIVSHYFAPIDILVTDLHDIPATTNVVSNAGFGSGTDFWTVTASSQGAGVIDGVFRFYRSIDGTAAQLRQDIGMTVRPGSPLQATVKLGNASAVTKKITVSILRIDGGATASQCSFLLAPNTPLQKYVINGVTPGVWSGIRIQIKGNTPDSEPAYLIDNVQLQYKPGATFAEACVTPSPGKPQIVTPALNGAYRTDFTVMLAEGKSNHAIGYDPAFHIQIDDNSDFGSPYFDNGGALADLPAIPVVLPGGALYIRARQYDGVEKFSGWTASVPFTVNPLPDKPVLTAPVGDVPAEGQSFVWTNGLQTTKYQLVVINRAGTVVAKINYPLPNAVCGVDICSVPLASVPVVWKTGKAYTWFVKAFNAAGKVKSTKPAFRLIATP
jgi:hypothetical protein